MTAAPLLFEAAGVLAVDKPAGIAVVPGRGAGMSLRERLEQELNRKLWVVHRLDRDTSGVLLFATDAATHRVLSMAFEAGQIQKRYLALVVGQVGAALEMNQALVPARRARTRLAREGEEGKAAHTTASPIEVFARASLLELFPLTGRSHQIRVHLAGAGFPLLIDHQYGREAPITAADLGGVGEGVLIARTPLHAQRLACPVLAGLAAFTVEAPLPADMAAALAVLQGKA